jgi:hypothetical protein
MSSKVIKISGEQTWIRPVVSATKIQRHGCRGGVVGHWLEHCGGRHQQRSTAAKVPAAASVESVINFRVVATGEKVNIRPLTRTVEWK